MNRQCRGGFRPVFAQNPPALGSSVAFPIYQGLPSHHPRRPHLKPLQLKALVRLILALRDSRQGFCLENGVGASLGTSASFSLALQHFLPCWFQESSHLQLSPPLDARALPPASRHWALWASTLLIPQEDTPTAKTSFVE